MVVNLLDNGFHLLTFANLTQNVSLEFKHWLPNDLVIEVYHIRRDLLLELRVFVHDWLQFLLPKAVCVNMVEGLVAEFRSAAKQIFISTNDGLVSELHVEVAEFVIRETHTVFSILFGHVGTPRDDIDLLIDFIILLKDKFFWLEESWLQRLQDLNHELRVLSVRPFIEIGVSIVGTIPNGVFSLHFEVNLEHIEEISKEEVLVDVGPNIVGQLIHESLILLGLDSVVLVILPVVFKIQFKLLSHLLRQWLIVVEMSQQTKPL